MDCSSAQSDVLPPPPYAPPDTLEKPNRLKEGRKERHVTFEAPSFYCGLENFVYLMRIITF